MNKYIVTVLGKDRPGIIDLITNMLFTLDCNLENVNQMILQEQFAGFFIVEAPLNLDFESFYKTFKEQTLHSDLTIHIDTVKNNGTLKKNMEGETFLITTIGPDQKGLVAKFSKIMARYNVNIENLRAVFKGGDDPKTNIMSYQIHITPDIYSKELFDSLRLKAGELDLDIRIQHKNIFDAINKI